MAFRNNLIRRGKQLISLNDTGSLNRKILFSGGMGGVDRVKIQSDICTHTHIYENKLISLFFNCVTPDSVSLACQLYCKS